MQNLGINIYYINSAMSKSNISKDIAFLFDLIMFINPRSPYDVIVSYEHTFMATQMFQSDSPVFVYVFSYIFETTRDILIT